MPAVLEKDNDGSVIYRVNIAEEKAIPEGEKEARPIGWSCYEVRTFAKPTKANLKRVFIRSVIDETAEFDLVNSYNKDALGIKKDAKAVAEYKEYLQFTDDVDAMLVADLSKITI
jgi:hypothetical protein